MTLIRLKSWVLLLTFITILTSFFLLSKYGLPDIQMFRVLKSIGDSKDDDGTEKYAFVNQLSVCKSWIQEVQNTFINYHYQPTVNVSEAITDSRDDWFVHLNPDSNVTSTKFFHFCLSSESPSSETVSHAVHEALASAYQGKNACERDDLTSYEVLFKLRKNSHCVGRNGEASSWETKCLLILPTLRSTLDFQDSETVTNLTVAGLTLSSTKFPRKNLLSLNTLFYFELVGAKSIDPAVVNNDNRPNLASLSIGRFTGSWSNKVLDDIRSLSTRDDMAIQDVRLFVGTTTDELDSCWSTQPIGDISQKLKDYLSWFPCSNAALDLSRSTFGLVPVDVQRTQYDDSLSWHTLLMQCLHHGAIPVLIGDGELPFPMAIKRQFWSLAIIQIHPRDIPNLFFILRSISTEKRRNLQYYGQILFRRYFANVTVQVASLLLELTIQNGLAKPVAPRQRTHSIHSWNDHIQLYESSRGHLLTNPTVREFVAASAIEKTQVTTMEIGKLIKLNPFWSFPVSPWSYSGKNLKFTVVVLYYDRYSVLTQTLKGLRGTQNLDSVVIVWNHPKPPDTSFRLPNIHVPIRIYKAQNNSLNNRFLPLDIINTEAVLALDDDMRLSARHLEIGFNVWKENREQLVGFPARSHAYDSKKKSWTYVADSSKEYSIILTSGAFLHAYYLYAYTWDMPYAVRNFIDAERNCEDIAINFHISHLTRKPPIKAMKEKYFPCNGCKSALSLRGNHYTRRSQCLNKFVSIYGYNPLIHTRIFMDQY